MKKLKYHRNVCQTVVDHFGSIRSYPKPFITWQILNPKCDVFQKFSIFLTDESMSAVSILIGVSLSFWAKTFQLLSNLSTSRCNSSISRSSISLYDVVFGKSLNLSLSKPMSESEKCFDWNWFSKFRASNRFAEAYGPWKGHEC